MEFSEEESKQIFKIFKEESAEHLSNINTLLLEFEKKPDDEDIISALFREAHSVKGAARMLEVLSIQDLAHKIEDFLGLIKDNNLQVTPEVIDVLCRGVDNISIILEKITYNTLDYVDENSVKLIAEIDNIVNKSLKSGQNNEIVIENECDNFQVNDNDNELSNNQKSTFTDSKSIFALISHYLSQLDNKFQKKESISEIINLISNSKDTFNKDEQREILSLVSENLNFINQNDIVIAPEMIEAIKHALDVVFVEDKEYDLKLIIQRQNILKQMLELTQKNDKLFNLPKKFQNFEIKEHNENFKKSQNIHNENSVDTSLFKTLRVDTKKLDTLQSTIDELLVLKIQNKQYLNTLKKILKDTQDLQHGLNKVYASINLTEKKEKNFNNSFEKNFINHIDKVNDSADDLYYLIDDFQKKFINDDIRFNFLIEEIENMVKNIRVLPLATIFHLFPRMIRDIAREQGKQVDVIMTGSETSADKTIIEEMKSPITHIIRNAIDHGIETPEERIKNGKNPTGKILLNTYHSGNSITIEIIDDGRGLSLNKIKQKAIDKNILSENELNSMSESQVMNLIFWPGFSTGDKVTDISGRGVGLDVVHTKISQLEGKVSIQSHEGQGFKIKIKIPITVATLKVLLVNIRNQIFAISSTYVKTVLSVTDDEIISKEGKSHIIYNGNSIKLIKLSDILSINSPVCLSNKHNIVLVQVEDNIFALEVDNFLRTEEILQKKMNPPLTRVMNISGVASLPTGESCLILNMNDILNAALYYNDNKYKRTISALSDKKQDTPKILIIDDSFTTITLEKNILKLAGFDVITANDGSEGLKKVSETNVDLIVTDLEMPVMNGIDFIKNFRLTNNVTPVIVLTALNDVEIEKLCSDVGANDFITKKDFSEKTFLDKINSYL